MDAVSESCFAQALLDPELVVPAGLTAHSGSTGLRFSVYRNNVIASLIGALETRFPAVRSIVGREFFAHCARLFVSNELPRTPLMMSYGDDFPAFLATLETSRDVPYLADVARIEAARTRAYHAADAPPLDPATLAALTPAALLAAKLDLHPSVEIVRSRYPALTIWAMNSGEAELTLLDLDAPEDAMIARVDDVVIVRRLPSGGADLLQSLQDAMALGEAASAAAAADRQFDLTINLAGLIGSGILTAHPANRLEGPGS